MLQHYNSVDALSMGVDAYKPKPSSSLLVQLNEAADEEFFAALALFDEDVKLATTSSDDELGQWLASCMGTTSMTMPSTTTRPFLFPSVVPLHPLSSTTAVVRNTGSTSTRDSNKNNSSEQSVRMRTGQTVQQEEYRMISAGIVAKSEAEPTKPKARLAPDTISPCGLRKSVKIDPEEMAILNPGFDQIAEILSSEMMTSILATEDDDEDLKCPSPDSTVTASNNKPGHSSAPVHSGETRLRIAFTSYGKVGSPVQHFGKSGFIIPDGLSGTHEMYDQPWKFEITHEPLTHKSGSSLVLITWKITNLASGAVTCVRETPQQATLREFSGRTICNKVVKMALSNRAKELESSVTSIHDNSKKQSVVNAVKVLRPKLCTVGLLFFGLLHDTVQKRVEL